ncbi:hypothetical protein PIB30_104889 [Stylosanthes scabra]|uniref:Uncharacterized protein n=1 Tax=Stylosanthes scabra TaxID=79078 RepID=A0ABU6QZC1_9FABA|nr:hypothetical protein [Stylosanthes scabra]
MLSMFRGDKENVFHETHDQGTIVMADNPNQGLTLRELCSPDLAFQLQHARLPGEDPIKHLKDFEVVCATTRRTGGDELGVMAGDCLLVKTPEEARELIENIADASQHFRTCATISSSKGVFGVTPNESPDLPKAMGDIASVLKDIREGQQNLLNTQCQTNLSS